MWSKVRWGRVLLASQDATWPVLILTLFAAACAARKVEPATAVLHSMLMGFLVAVIFGVLYFAPFNLWAC
jgi:hypothetical protein